MKDYLGYENERNKKHAAVYERFLRLALKHDNLSVLVGHHICFELNGDLATENEVPSADCLMFDHELMGAVFGGTAKHIMQQLAAVPAEKRDELFNGYLEYFAAHGEATA